jgi:membrane-associated phospholipid phosphatase
VSLRVAEVSGFDSGAAEKEEEQEEEQESEGQDSQAQEKQGQDREERRVKKHKGGKQLHQVRERRVCDEALKTGEPDEHEKGHTRQHVMPCNVRTLALSAVLGCGVLQTPLGAQRDTTSDPRLGVVRRRDLITVGGVALAALALTQVDRRTDAWARRDATQKNELLRALAQVGDRTGTYASTLVGPATWLLGVARRDSGTQVMGIRTTEAVGLAGVTIAAMKVIGGRRRPYASADQSPTHWDFLGGARSDSVRSFASGHTALSTAAAVVLASEWRRQGVRGWRTVGPPLAWSLAAVAGGSRIRDRQHWVTDVATGAAVGVFSAALVRRWHDAHIGSWLDRRFTRR